MQPWVMPNATHPSRPNHACVLNVASISLHCQAKRKLTGIMNFTNPGAISHNEVS